MEQSIFQNLTTEEMQELKQIGAIRQKRFDKQEMIFRTGEQVHEIGIVQGGSVIIENNDLWGNRSILNIVSPGQVFAESYAHSHLPIMVDVIAAETTEILFLDVRVLRENQYSSCTWYVKLMQNLLQIATQKNRILSSRIFCTSAKTIRGRLSTYFSEQMVENNSRTFDIPFNRQQLADYLNLDRSALSKELCRMRDEGLIRFRKNHFEILENNNI